MRQQVVGFCELYMLLMGSWSVMGGSTLEGVSYMDRAQEKFNLMPTEVEDWTELTGKIVGQWTQTRGRTPPTLDNGLGFV